jgi:hypothetical protein
MGWTIHLKNTSIQELTFACSNRFHVYRLFFSDGEIDYSRHKDETRVNMKEEFKSAYQRVGRSQNLGWEDPEISSVGAKYQE